MAFNQRLAIVRFLFIVSITCFQSILSDESSHQYEDGEVISVWMNKVGPFNNPTETYPYFSSHVPFCNRAEHIDVKHHEIHYSKFDGLGSVLEVMYRSSLCTITSLHSHHQ